MEGQATGRYILESAPGPTRTEEPIERLNFRRLIAENPNYFGNLAGSPLPPVSGIAGNTTFEQLTCIGLNPALDLLEATVQVKLPFGYSGNLCQKGSIEYVRFYADYGGGWQDLGLAAVDTHDLPNALDCAQAPNKPLSYVVTLPVQLKMDFCGHPVMPAIRGILSWEMIPPAGSPNWTPVWGNRLDQHVLVNPRPWLIADLAGLVPEAQKAHLPPGIEAAGLHPIPLPDPPPVPLARLAELYGAHRTTAQGAAGGHAVESHRFGLEQLHAALVTSPVEQASAAAAVAEWQKLGLNWAEAVAALDKTLADVSYEQLDCLGLDVARERLVATLHIKRPAGYSGDLCHRGSLEYVAFWADWQDACHWTYLGTASVNVHDITTIPADGLHYSVVLPVNLNAIRRPCEKPMIARVRAVLSWAVPPSTVDPDALTTWGNRLDAHVQVRPGDPIPVPAPIIWTAGGIRLADIDVVGNGMTKPNVNFALFGTPADEWAPYDRPCPFGGRLVIQGPSFPGLQYRFWAQDLSTGAAPVLITEPFWTVPPVGPGTWRTPNLVTGYSPYLDFMTQNIENVLAYWTPGGNDLWQIRMEMADMGGTVLSASPWYRLRLDNTGPRRKPLGEPPLLDDTMAIHIDGGGDCKDFTKGATINGRFVARDNEGHFGAYQLMTLPVSLSPPNPTPSSGILQTVPALPAPGGDSWSLNTGAMNPCGYVVVLQVWDRSIVNSYPSSHNSNYTDVGFCLRAPAP